MDTLPLSFQMKLKQVKRLHEDSLHKLYAVPQHVKLLRIAYSTETQLSIGREPRANAVRKADRAQTRAAALPRAYREKNLLTVQLTLPSLPLPAPTLLFSHGIMAAETNSSKSNGVGHTSRFPDCLSLRNFPT